MKQVLEARRIPRRKSWTAIAAAVAASFTSGSRADVFIGQDFTASNYNQTSPLSPVPDTMGAVGPFQVVELINGRYAVYRKSDHTLVQSSTLDQFWIDGGVTPANHAFDPRVVYDP